MRLTSLVCLCVIGSFVASAEEKLPPYKRLLEGKDKESAEKWEAEMKSLQAKGEFGSALDKAKKILALRKQKQGADHWQVVDAEWNVKDLRRMVAFSPTKRDKVVRFYGIEEKTEALQKKAKYPELIQAFEMMESLAIDLFGEEHLITADVRNSLGLALTDSGRFGPGKTRLEQALASCERTLPAFHPRIALVQHNLAFNASARGNPSEAIRLDRKVILLRSQILGKDHPHLALTHINLGGALQKSGAYEEAELHYRLALPVLERNGSNVDKVFVMNNLGHLLIARGQFENARAYFEKALPMSCETLGEQHPGTAFVFHNLGTLLGEQGLYAESEPLIRRGLAIRKALFGRSHPAVVQSLNSLGMLMTERGQAEQAEPIFREALESIRLAVPNHPTVGVQMNNLAYNLAARGKDAEAEKIFLRTLEFRRRVLPPDHPDIGVSATHVARALESRKEYVKAEAFHRETLSAARKLSENHPRVIYARFALARNLLRQDKEQGVSLFENGVQQARGVLRGHRAYLSERQFELAMIYDSRDNRKDALQFANQAEESFEKARLGVGFEGLERSRYTSSSSPRLFLACLLAREGKAERAWNTYETSLAPGLRDDLAARYARPLTKKERQQEEDLVGRLALAEKNIDALRKAKDGEKKHAQRMKELLDQQEKDRISLGELQTTFAKKYGLVAGEVFRRERIQDSLPADTALVGWLDVKNPYSEGDSGHHHWACVLRKNTAPIWVRLSGTGEDKNWTEADSALAKNVMLQCRATPRDAALDWKPLASKLYTQRVAPLLPHLKGIDHLVMLPSEGLAGVPLEVLLEAAPKPPKFSVSYCPSGSMFAWLRAKQPRRDRRRALVLGDPVFLEPSKEEKLPDPPAKGVLLTTVRPGSNAAKAGMKSGDILLGYDGADITDIPSLRTALMKRAQKGSIDKIAVNYWRNGKEYSSKMNPGSMGVMPSPGKADAAWKEFMKLERLLAKRGGDSFARLEGTEREAVKLGQLFAGSDVLLHSKASEQELHRLASTGKLSDYRILHLATHGIANPRSPMQSFLALAQDKLPDGVEQVLAGKPVFTGRLTADHILRTWKLDADLVVLSACQTGLGKYERGEGYVGFAQALLLAGSRSMVVSRWSVNDDATVLLMIRFYENLLGKRKGLDSPMSKADALREAKSWLRQLGKDEVDKRVEALNRGTRFKKSAPVAAKPFAHPNYWAAFILVGDER